MTLLQTQIDFKTHLTENNSESQNHLLQHRDCFNKQMRTIFGMLIDGKELTSKTALLNYSIGHLPRRILDLREAGVLISDRWENNSKVWYMTEYEKQFNQKYKL